MAKERTPESDVPLTARLKRFAGGRGKDISLPLPPGGKRDPRLPAAPRGLGESLREASKGLKTVRELGKSR